MPTLKIDNIEVQVEQGATILDAARKLGLDIPALCHRDGCDANTSCLACVVKVNGLQRLVPSCATKVIDGMSVESETPEIREARRTALELLLADHAGDCYAPCANVCPAHMDIPRMIRQIGAGELREAIVTVKQRIALPATLGRICPEICEKGCRRASIDEAVSICQLKRFVADMDLSSDEPYLPPAQSSTAKRIAIIGSGPAGLAAAWRLLQLGHGCELFDEHPAPGGNLRYGVERERLPESVLDAEIELIRKLGAKFNLNARLGRELSLEQLTTQFDAVLLACGQIDKPAADELGLAYDVRGLKLDKHSMLTSRPGVFAAGGIIVPLKHAIRAIASGDEAAQRIHEYILGLRPTEAQRFTVRLGVLNDGELAMYGADASKSPRALQHVDGLAAVEAIAEARRCMECDCARLEDCKLRRYAAEYGANPLRYKTDRRPFEREVTHESVAYEAGKCIACGLCVQIANQEGEALGLTFVGRGFRVKIGVPFDKSMAEALRKAADKCVAGCPTGALSTPAGRQRRDRS